MNGISKMFEAYEDYEELCKIIDIVPRNFNSDDWVDEYFKLKREDERNE